MQASKPLAIGLAATFAAILLALASPAAASSTTVHSARGTIRFFQNHGFLLHRAKTRPIALREIRRARAFLAAHPAASPWPPHHQLWLCIASSEGSPTSVNPNGHFGMLQMHAGWGYGTSYHASDDPQTVQEWAAERAYAASGYSNGFLEGQWLRWDGRFDCLRYARG